MAEVVPEIAALADAIRGAMESGNAPEVNPELLAAVKEILGPPVEPDESAELLKGALIARGRAVVLQQEAAELFDAADRAEYTLSVTEKAQAAAERLADAEAEAETLAEVARVTLGAERHAEDQAAGAAEFYRECRDAAEEAALTGDTPETQVELGLKADKAQTVLNGFAVAAEKATRARVEAEEARESARELVKLRKTEKAQADEMLAGAPDAEISMSEYTLLFDGLRRVFAGVAMTGDERESLQGAARELADFTGVTRLIRNEEKKRIEDENYRQVTSRILPAQGHPLRPASSVIPSPVR